MASYSGSSSGTTVEMIEASRSSNDCPRSSSRLAKAAPSSSPVDSRTVAKRQCSTSSASRKVPKWVWVLPTSTTRSMGLATVVRMRGVEPRLAFLLRASELLGESLDYEETLQRVADLAVPDV